MKAMLEIQGLKKYFKVPSGQLHAVDDVSFSIRQGETLGIVGESGCGKSTLGRVILRLHEPTAGNILYQGMNIATFDREEMRQMRKHMQIIFQDPYASLNPRFTVSQIIEEPLKLHRIYGKEADRKRRVEEIMALVGLPMRSYNAYPHEFDGGRRQRIVIARALVINPKFIICDEPVSALDVSVQAQILNLMMSLQEKLGLTYIFISHDLSVVKHISTDIGVMYLGQLIEKAPKKVLFRRPLHPYTMCLLSAIPSTNIHQKKQRIVIRGEITSPINPKPGCRFAARCPYMIERCCQETPPLQLVDNQHEVACFRAVEFQAGYEGR